MRNAQILRINQKNQITELVQNSNLTYKQIVFLDRLGYIKNTLQGTRTDIKKSLNGEITYLDELTEHLDKGHEFLHGESTRAQIAEMRRSIYTFMSIVKNLQGFKIENEVIETVETLEKQN